MVEIAAISQYLEGLDFKTTKVQVVEHVCDKKAPQNIIETLQKMPGERYSSMAVIWHAIGKVA